MADWANPTLTSTYTNFLSDLKARDEDLAKMFDGQTVSNVPTDAIRWSSSNNRFEKWSGSAWGQLSTGYAINITGNAATVTNGVYTTGNQTIGGSKTFTEELNAAGRINITGNGASLRIGANRTASTGLSYIDLIAATGQDYGLRVSRGGGVNGGTDFEHLGTGDFRMVASNAAWYKVVTSGIDRFAISSLGDVYINTTFNAFPGNENTNQGAAFAATDALWLSQNNKAALQVNRNGDGNVIFFRRAGVGLTGNGIAVSGTQVNYVTSSDYRLKQSLGLVSDAIDRVLRVPVRRYTRDGGGELIHDGFFAHELQQVAPYAVTGERDAVDKAGQPIYQGIDLGKAVPLLWAAVQELAKKLDSL